MQLLDYPTFLAKKPYTNPNKLHKHLRSSAFICGLNLIIPTSELLDLTYLKQLPHDDKFP